jgi:DNA-binding beta-propeller fold protein YncE
VVLAVVVAVLLAGVGAEGAAAAACAGSQDCPYSGVAVFGQQGQGSLRFPQAVAVDGQGDVWVADQYSSVVQRFTPRGRFLSQFGSYGDGPGELGSVGGLAVDARGNIDVLDSSHDRVEQFTPRGALVRQWGSAGNARGQFLLGDRSPVAGGGLAAFGHAIYVADTNNDRVEQFTLDGRFVRAFGMGRLRRPQGVAAARDRVVVADDRDHRIIEFDAAGHIRRTAGSRGIGAGRFRFPYDVSLDAAGDTWVVDNNGHRVVELDPALRAMGAVGGLGAQPGQFAYPRSLAVDPLTGRVYVADTANNRIQVLGADRGPVDAWGVSGRGPGNLTLPSDVAVDDQDHVAVADTVDDRIELLDASGHHVNALGTGDLDRPLGVGPGLGGLVVSDTYHDRVVLLAPDGSLVRELAVAGSAPGQVHSPHSVARGPHGDEWIADTGNDRLLHLNADGSFAGIVGGFSGPQDVTVDAAGAMYVADTGNGQIVVDTPPAPRPPLLGLLLPAGHDTVTTIGGFQRPVGVATFGKTLYVLDQQTDTITALDRSGHRLFSFGAAGTKPGEFTRPAGLAVTSDGQLVVGDPRNNRVQLFTFGGRAAPASSAPAQGLPAAPPKPLAGRLLAPAAADATKPLTVRCRASEPGFCDVTASYRGRLLASARRSLPDAGQARRVTLTLPKRFVRTMPRHAIVDVHAVIRNGAGERITQHARITLRIPAHPHHKH